MEIRPATEADLPAEHDVFRAAMGELFRRHSFYPPDPSAEAFAAYQGHLLRHDGERCFTAEEDGRIVGFTAALVRGETWFLSSLFVHPAAQSRGVGRELLAKAWGEGFARRLTMTDAIQPVSNGLYGRMGLIPVTPVLAVAGAPRADEDHSLDAAPADPSALADLDAAAYGFDRAIDHAYWSQHATVTLWRRDGEPLGYAYRWPDGRIGPLAGRSGPAAADALRAELARAGTASLLIPGSARELVAAALEAGLRLTRPPGLLLVSEGVEAPTALAVSGFAHF